MECAQAGNQNNLVKPKISEKSVLEVLFKNHSEDILGCVFTKTEGFNYSALKKLATWDDIYRYLKNIHILEQKKQSLSLRKLLAKTGPADLKCFFFKSFLPRDDDVFLPEKLKKFRKDINFYFNAPSYSLDKVKAILLRNPSGWNSDKFWEEQKKNSLELWRPSRTCWTFLPDDMPEITDKFDGFILLSNHIGFLNDGLANIIISRPKIVIELKSKDIKGSRYLIEKRVWKIPLAYVGGLPLDICVTAPLSARNIDYDVFRQTYVSSIDSTLNKLKGSDTFNHFCALRGNGSFMNLEKPLWVYSCDFNDFTTLFRDAFKIKFIQAFERDSIISTENVEVHYFVSVMGQANKIEALEPFVDKIFTNQVEEFIVHVARDYSNTDQYILFSEYFFQQRFGPPDKKFYPGLVEGFGNFYVFKPPTSESLHVSLIKCYGSFGKYVNHNFPRPFNRCSIAELVLSKQIPNFCNSIDLVPDYKLSENLDLLARHVETFGAYSAARVEVIVSCRAKATFVDIVQIANQHFHYFECGHIIHQVPLKYVKNHVKNHILPHVQFLNQVLQRHNEDFFALTDVLKTFIAEVCISAFLYGRKNDLRILRNCGITWCDGICLEGVPKQCGTETFDVSRIFTEAKPLFSKFWFKNVSANEILSVRDVKKFAALFVSFLIHVSASKITKKVPGSLNAQLLVASGFILQSATKQIMDSKNFVSWLFEFTNHTNQADCFPEFMLEIFWVISSVEIVTANKSKEACNLELKTNIMEACDLELLSVLEREKNILCLRVETNNYMCVIPSDIQISKFDVYAELYDIIFKICYFKDNRITDLMSFIFRVLLKNNPIVENHPPISGSQILKIVASRLHGNYDQLPQCSPL